MTNTICRKEVLKFLLGIKKFHRKVVFVSKPHFTKGKKVPKCAKEVHELFQLCLLGTRQNDHVCDRTFSQTRKILIFLQCLYAL